MKSTVLAPLGIVVTDLDLRACVDEDSFAPTLRGLLGEHGVVIMPDQKIDDRAFVAFLRSCGELTFTQGETAVGGFPDLNVVSNVGRPTPRSTFHVDTSYVRRPPAYTALRAVEIPAEGGQTLFSNQYRAYERLPNAVHEALAGKTITHVVTGLDLAGDAETAADHPVFRPHPITGQLALYLSSPQRCAAVSGMSPAEAEATVMMLFEHSTAPENVLRHSWSPGDIVMWDNGCVLHKADHANVVGDRVLHRGMVADYGPLSVF